MGGMKAKVHVNQHIIKSNTKNGLSDPPLSIKTYKYNIKATEISFTGPTKLVYRPESPLSCGANVWIEAEFEDIEYV